MARTAATWSKEKPPPRRGNRKGSPNRIKAEVADIVRQSLTELGGVTYLVWVAKRKPEAYCSLLGRVIPRDVRVSGGVAWLDVVKAVSAQASVADASGPAQIEASARVIDATATLVSAQLDRACSSAADQVAPALLEQTSSAPARDDATSSAHPLDDAMLRDAT